ncbi:MAG: oxidoreductase, partial [Bauldia sp.]|nr:oxidoreductase [Bauldia sp.]
YGGSFENRIRLLLEVAQAVRGVWPEELPLLVRLSATDWMEGGFNPDEAVVVARALKAEGVAYICASSGGIHPKAVAPDEPHYQVHLAERIRREASIPTRAVGLIDDPLAADAIVRDGQADLVALARAMLADPRWPWRAASMLGAEVPIVNQYARSKRVIDKWAPPATSRDAAA